MVQSGAIDGKEELHKTMAGAVLSPLVGVPEAALLLNLSEKTLRKWILLRKLDYVKTGTRVQFKRKVLEDYIERQTVKALE